jgi:hypothetical protein
MGAYRRHPSDFLAARELGIHESSFQKWRNRHGLPAKAKAEITPEEHLRRQRAWLETANSQKAAERLGLEPDTFRAWLRMQDLPSRIKLQQVDVNDESSKHSRYLRAYYQAKSDREAASLLGVPHDAFSRWRRRNRLPKTAEKSRQRHAEKKSLRRQTMQ